MNVVGDTSGKGGGLLYEVRKTVMRQAEVVVDACVETALSAFHTLRSSTENAATVAVTFLQNMTSNVKNKFGKFSATLVYLRNG